MSKTEGKPRNFKELFSKFKKQKNETKEKIKETAPEIAESIIQTGELFVEATENIPGVAKEMIERGLEEQKNRIDAEFGEVSNRANDSKENLDKINKGKETKQANWQGKNQTRGKNLRNVVDTINKSESAVRNVQANAVIKGSKVAAKAASVVGLGKKGQELQEFADKKAQEYASNSQTTNKATKAVESVWAAQDRAQSVKDRAKSYTATFQGQVAKAEENQAQEATTNNRSERGAEFVKGVGKIGLKVRSLFQKAEMGVQGKVGAVQAATFKTKKANVKKAQKATLKRHEKGIASPAEVKVAQGIMNGVYYVEDRVADVGSWTKSKAKSAKDWTDKKVNSVKEGVKDAKDAAYIYADDARKAVVGAKDTVVLTAMEGAENVGKAVKSAKDTVAISAMVAADSARDAVITVADAGMGTVATAAAFAELAKDGVVAGSKFVAGKAKQGAKTAQAKVSETESKVKSGFFKSLSSMGHSVKNKISNVVKSIDAKYAASEIELAAKQATPEKLATKQQESRDEEQGL